MGEWEPWVIIQGKLLIISFIKLVLVYILFSDVFAHCLHFYFFSDADVVLDNVFRRGYLLFILIDINLFIVFSCGCLLLTLVIVY